MKGELFWFRYEPRRELAEARHLTAFQFGCHMLLKSYAWERAECSIPADEDWIARRLGISADEYASHVAPMLDDLWVREGRDWVNENLRKERLEAAGRSAHAQAAAFARHHGPKVTPLKPKEKV